jgi:cysteine desulfurase family protein (TIGR01976 family)
MAALLGAKDESTISIGQNMTTLNFSLARAIARVLQPGDEVVITQLDHEANRGPWLTLRPHGIVVREVLLKTDGTLDYDDFEGKINERTRLVAMGMSSNAIGTVNKFNDIRTLTYKYGAWLLLDGVHYAPHFSIDVGEIGCDFLLCSAYKFYGPHVGFLYTKPGLLDRLPTDRLRTADQRAPYSIETGTLNHAAIAGAGAAIDFLSGLGEGATLREKLKSAYENISAHELRLARHLYNELKRVAPVTLVGQDFSSPRRTPTVSFLWEGKRAEEVCEHLAGANICAWDGHFYAIRAIEALGLLEKGGVTRLGISLYNTMEEMDFTIEQLQKLK